jgi:hypothetical protein
MKKKGKKEHLIYKLINNLNYMKIYLTIKF